MRLNQRPRSKIFFAPPQPTSRTPTHHPLSCIRTAQRDTNVHTSCGPTPDLWNLQMHHETGALRSEYAPSLQTILPRDDRVVYAPHRTMYSHSVAITRSYPSLRRTKKVIDLCLGTSISTTAQAVLTPNSSAASGCSAVLCRCRNCSGSTPSTCFRWALPACQRRKASGQ